MENMPLKIKITNKRSRISEHWLRNKIHKALKELGINEKYARASDGRNLWLYSSHSLRGHAGTHIYDKTHNLRSVQKILDHSPRSYSSTMLYVGNREDDLKDVLRK